MGTGRQPSLWGLLGALEMPVLALAGALDGAYVEVVTAMGRMAAHTGQMVTYDQMLNANQFAPGIETLTMESDSPLQPNEDGSYPVPEPGITKATEY